MSTATRAQAGGKSAGFQLEEARDYWRYAPTGVGTGKIDSATLATLEPESFRVEWAAHQRSRFDTYWEEVVLIDHLVARFKGKRVLSLGSGLGLLERCFVDAGCDVTCADIVRSNLDVIDRMAEVEQLPNLKTLYVDQSDRADYGGPYDLIFSWGVVHHMPAELQRRVIQRFEQSLAPGGRVVLMLYTWRFVEATVGVDDPVAFARRTDPSVDGSHNPWSDWYDVPKLGKLIDGVLECRRYQSFNQAYYGVFELARPADPKDSLPAPAPVAADAAAGDGLPGILDLRLEASLRLTMSHRITPAELTTTGWGEMKLVRGTADIRAKRKCTTQYLAETETIELPDAPADVRALIIDCEIKEGGLSVGVLNADTDTWVATRGMTVGAAAHQEIVFPANAAPRRIRVIVAGYCDEPGRARGILRDARIIAGYRAGSVAHVNPDVAGAPLSGPALAGLTHLVRRSLAGYAVRSLTGEQEPTPTMRTVNPPFSSVQVGAWRDALNLWRDNGLDLIAGLPTRNCPACDDASGNRIFTTYDGYPIVECPRCTTWYVPHGVTMDLYEKFFQKVPNARGIAADLVKHRDDPAVAVTDAARIGAYLDRVASIFPIEGRRMLDIGTATGRALDAATQRGMRATGIEVDPVALEEARRAGRDVRPGYEHLEPDDRFDLVTLFETIEHLADPVGVIGPGVDRLAPGGLVYITAPNLDSPEARLGREACFWVNGGVFTPGHVNIFGVRSYEHLFDRLGLELLAVDSQYASNHPELAALLLRCHRGAMGFLCGEDGSYHLPGDLEATINNLGPLLATVERAHDAAPILNIIACRRGERDRHAEAIATFKQRKRAAIVSEFNTFLSQGRLGLDGVVLQEILEG